MFEALPEVPLEKIPVPAYVKALVVVTILALGVGLARFPAAVSDGVMYERSQRLISAGKLKEAEPLLVKLNTKFPDANDVTFDLMETYIANHQLEKAQELLLPFNGVRVKKRDGARIVAIQEQLVREMNKAETKK